MSAQPARVIVRDAVVLTLAAVLLAGLPLASGGNVGQGGGPYRVEPFAEIQTTDGSIAALAASPSPSDPGPRAWSNVDRFTFNGRWTNVRHVVTLDVQEATNGEGGSVVQVQGVAQPVASWLRVRTEGATFFGTTAVAGAFDADASAYAAPGGFTKDAQGLVTLRLYDQDSPADDGVVHVVYWIYDAGANAYWFDAVDKDFTNGNGEVRVYPIGHNGRTQYVFPVEDLRYAATAVAGAGSGYVPTVAVAWHKMPGPPNGHDFEAYILADFPAGAPADTYSFTVRATIASMMS